MCASWHSRRKQLLKRQIINLNLSGNLQRPERELGETRFRKSARLSERRTRELELCRWLFSRECLNFASRQVYRERESPSRETRGFLSPRGVCDSLTSLERIPIDDVTHNSKDACINKLSRRRRSVARDPYRATITDLVKDREKCLRHVETWSLAAIKPRS